MVSLDDAVVARLERSGSRFEILVDPDLAQEWKRDPESNEMGDVLAVEEIWADSRQGDRPNEADLVKAFGTSEVFACAAMILEKGTIQLTTQQRKAMTEEKRKKIVHAIASTATDPRTKSPHPRTRIENALEESRFSVDPFLSVERQVEDAIKVLKPLIPLQFVMAKMAFRIPGSDYGGVLGVLRDLVEREEWLSNGDWACVITCPGGMKHDLIDQVMKKCSRAEVRELDR